LFCCEKEPVHHLFFDCVVARHLWNLTLLFFIEPVELK